MRESRLGFGCQLVFSAIISSAVSTNAPDDPAPLSHLAAAQRHAQHRAANKQDPRTLRVHGRLLKPKRAPPVAL